MIVNSYWMLSHLPLYIGKEISVELNNGMVLSNDVTLMERKLKCKLFSAVNTYEYPLHYTLYSMNKQKEVHGEK